MTTHLLQERTSSRVNTVLVTPILLIVRFTLLADLRKACGLALSRLTHRQQDHDRTVTRHL